MTGRHELARITGSANACGRLATRTLTALACALTTLALMLGVPGTGHGDDNAVVIPPGTCMRVAEKYVNHARERDPRYIEFFKKCGDRDTLDVLLRGFATSRQASNSLTLAAAVQATMSAPALKNDAWGATRLSETLPTIDDADSRAMLVPILGVHNQRVTLAGLLTNDPSARVRKAAAVALAECSPAIDSDLLFEAARSDPSPEVREASWMTLERLGRLRRPEDLLAALNAQRDAAAAVQLFQAWIDASPAPASPVAYAEQLVTLARAGTRNQATGALATIVNVLETSDNGDSQKNPLPVNAEALHEALEQRRIEIASAALRRFSAPDEKDRNAAAVDFAAFAAAEGCTTNDCISATPRILDVTDKLPARLASEASAMFAAVSGSGFVAFRRQQYIRAIIIAAFIILIGVCACLWWNGITAATPAITAFGAFAAGAVLQLFATTHAAAAWPPLRLWPTTFVGNITIATMIAVLAAFAFPAGRRRTVAALATAEVLWWLLPLALAAVGMAFQTRNYDADSMAMAAPIAGACAVPLLTWALVGLGGILSQHLVARQSRDPQRLKTA